MIDVDFAVSEHIARFQIGPAGGATFVLTLAEKLDNRFCCGVCVQPDCKIVKPRCGSQILQSHLSIDHLLRCGASAYEIFINYYNELKGKNFLALPP